MRLRLRLLLLSLFALTLIYAADGPRIIITGRNNTGGMFLWINQPTDNDNWTDGFTTWSQFITNDTASAKLVTKVVCRFSSTTGAQTVKAGIWTTPDESGTQIGGYSSDVAITTSEADYAVTWTSHPSLAPNTAYYIVWKNSGGASEMLLKADTIAGGTGYKDTTFAAYRGNTIVSSGTVDWVFSVYTE